VIDTAVNPNGVGTASRRSCEQTARCQRHGADAETSACGCATRRTGDWIIAQITSGIIKLPDSLSAHAQGKSS
jgi:hypothetical protein